MTSIRITDDGAIRTLTLTGAEVGNVVSMALAEELQQLVSDAAVDSGIRALLLTGEGKHFCTGVDLVDAQEQARDPVRYVSALLDAQFRLAKFPGPVVVAAQGRSMGFGAELAVAADQVVSTSDATFAFPECSLGMAPGLATVRLGAVIGDARARRVMMSGRPFSADDAHEWGLVGSVVDQESLADEACKQAEELSRGHGPTLGWMKALTLPDDHAYLVEAVAQRLAIVMAD